MEESKAPNEKPGEKQKYPLVTVELALLLFCMAYFTAGPTTSNLILTKVCLQEFTNTTEEFGVTPLQFCRNSSNALVGKNDYVQEYSTRWEMYKTLVYFIPAFFSVSFAGSWGDKFGRKFPLMIPPPALILNLVVMGIFDIYIETAPLPIVLVVDFIHGLSGGLVVFISSCYSYLVSITDHSQRIKRLSILESMIITSATIGPLVSLALRNQWGNYAVYFYCATVCFIGYIYIVFFLKQVPPLKKTKLSIGSLANFNNVKDSFKVLVRPRKKSNRKFLIMIVGLIFMHFFLDSNNVLTYPLVKDAPLSWNFQQFAILSSTISGITGFCMMVIFPLIRTYLRCEDNTIAILATTSACLHSIVFGFATTSALVYIARTVGVIAGFALISYRTMASKLVESDEEGKVFSLLAISENSSTLIGITVYNAVWPVTRKIFRGLTFEVCAGLALISLSLLIYLRLKMKKEEKEEGPIQTVSIKFKADA